MLFCSRDKDVSDACLGAVRTSRYRRERGSIRPEAETYEKVIGQIGDTDPENPDFVLTLCSHKMKDTHNEHVYNLVSKFSVPEAVVFMAKHLHANIVSMKFEEGFAEATIANASTAVFDDIPHPQCCGTRFQDEESLQGLYMPPPSFLLSEKVIDERSDGIP